MIDKVELRIPNFIHFAGPFNRLFRDLRNDPKGPFHPSQHYMTVGDLRDFGYPAILHMHNVHDKRGNHKLELVETGAMAYSQMRHEIERVFAVNTNRDGLELMRLDLAADIEGVPVSWFERNIQAKWKRFTAGIGTIGEPVEFSEMGSKGIQTFYFGRRPNVFRIYDKVAERQYRYRRWIARARRRGTPDAEIPTFEQMFGHSESSFILTRVERQMAAGKVPEALSTFDKLRSAAEFDPFTSLIFAGVGRPEPNPDDYDLPTFCMGMYLRQRIEEQGFHRVKQWVNQHSQRNANRILDRLRDFFPDDGCFISPQGIFERYRDSVSQQLAA